MGAWGAGGFENDTALDFAGKVTDEDSLLKAFSEAPGGVIDADEATRMIAAAECVAAMLGRPAGDMPADLAEKLKPLGAPDEELLEVAREHVSMVISASELSELWAEADDTASFNLAMTGLIDRLNPELKPKKGKKKKPLFDNSPCAFCNEPMGEEEYGSFAVTVDIGADEPITIRKSAHLRCLNARLHPTHIIQAWKTDPEAIEREMARIFGGGDDA
ncbi:MAG: DUF4259 domain-containing protein [Pseudomonadota bacterium]